MASQMAILARTRSLAKTLNANPTFFKTITTFSFLSQEPQLAAEPTQPAAPEVPLPPNPTSYPENWRTPPSSAASAQSLLPLGFLQQSPSFQIQSLSQDLDSQGLLNVFADWMTSQKWTQMKQLFELWIRSLDKNGKPNKPDVSSYNHYLRANLMSGASPAEMLDLVASMEDHGVEPNTASFNLVLKAMHGGKESEAAEKLLQRMLQTGNVAPPDDESYNIVVSLLLQSHRVDAALKYIDLTLKSGYMVSMQVFKDCVQGCVNTGRLDSLVSIIDKCKSMDQNKALCPPWNLCNYIADVALQADNSKLAVHALKFMANWIARGEQSRPAVYLSVDEGLLLSALATAGRTSSSTLVDASWAILLRSLRQKKVPNPESYLAKISALASLGELERAFITLREFETTYANSSKEVEEELFSPFTSLYPLVVACSKTGFETLDLVYFQLESLSRADPPYKSVAALNCIVLGCANIWDLDRAYQTFEAISSTFGLTPDIHSYNALMHAFGKLKKTSEAARVFEHLVSLGVRPNAMSYSLLVDAHLINRDPKAALSVIKEMVNSGFEPSKETLKKVKRRCMREMDYESDDLVEDFAKRFNLRMDGEARRNRLFELNYSTGYA
ncbi:putative tetratricopeptide-like helical domain-containing protein [Rosa chinensis]|uniref:Putative tetratricopeptide-like helical domain-containing protein n=1 Tax=Rosa chinensis TaxID=74649 RepID=A0A2P6R2J0_ROSCH|nr:pentatricopeptide repeat-containing protein At1g26460, mitochondrial [Rosa chinensis]PRQ40662.1 putative tetratricopeptide-like helical domain-containing protein [Rosa chinensis]